MNTNRNQVLKSAFIIFLQIKPREVVKDLNCEHLYAYVKDLYIYFHI